MQNQTQTPTDILKQYIQQVIDREINKYARRPLLPSGKKYKRLIHDRLFEEKKFNADYFTDQAILIWERKSTLPRSERDFIEYVANEAMARMAKKVVKKTNDKIC